MLSRKSTRRRDRDDEEDGEGGARATHDEPLLARDLNMLRHAVVDPEADEPADCRGGGREGQRARTSRLECEEEEDALCQPISYMPTS